MLKDTMVLAAAATMTRDAIVVETKVRPNVLSLEDDGQLKHKT